MLKDITQCAFQSLRKPLRPLGIVFKHSRNCIARVSHSPTMPHILVVSLQNLAQPNASDLLGVLMGPYSKARPTRVGSAFKWKGEVGFQREEWLSLKHRRQLSTSCWSKLIAESQPPPGRKALKRQGRLGSKRTSFQVHGAEEARLPVC